MFGIRKKAAKTAKRAGLLTGGLLLCSVGTAFLTVAGWLTLVPIVGAQTTATIIAAIYLGVGFILIGVGSRSTEMTDHKPDTETARVPEGPPIMQAFMYGLQAGAQADRSKH